MRCYIVPHTHWDREWYLTFQQFRFKLVQLVDKLLEILEKDPSFSHFTLDGQAIILEDYLEIRPENRSRLENLISSGRLIVGPWYVLPDELLVSGESLIRNLQRGLKICRTFGPPMMVGYVPDQFGHIAQLPQLLKGFGIGEAVLWRGVSGECRDAQFWWESPDGSRAAAIYLADSYSNAAGLPVDAEELAENIVFLVENLRSYLSVDAALLMNGSDHLFPQPHLPGVLEEAGQKSGMELVISTLPRYIDHVREAGAKMPVIRGELLSRERAPLLVSCASARIYQKIRNHRAETLLEKYAEPLSAWAWIQGSAYPGGFLDESWKLLLQNHPHDSICGCSNDQVHREIETRFDEGEQIGELIRDEGLRLLTCSIDTSWLDSESGVLVYNPHPRKQRGLVEAELPQKGNEDVTALVNEKGEQTPWQPLGGTGGEYFSISLSPLQARVAMGWVGSREFQGLYLNEIKIKHPQGGEMKVEILLGSNLVGELDLEAFKQAGLKMLKEDKSIKRVQIVARQSGQRGVFVAEEVPGCGWRSYGAAPAETQVKRELSATRSGLENSLYRVKINSDGTLDILDKKEGVTLKGLHRLVDGGDCGDLYTYTAPSRDRLINRPKKVRVMVVETGPVRATLKITSSYMLPRSLSDDRRERSRQRVLFHVITEVSLIAGLPGIHFQTEVDNNVLDHRLRVHFPVPFLPEWVWVDGHFAVVNRQIQPPPGDYSNWAEKPDGLGPQKNFISLDQDGYGVSLINYGLPEYEVLPVGSSAEMALTLLRSVGWLSRDDLPNRPEHAGPAVETPEGQCPGRHRLRYSLIPHRGNWQDAGIKDLAASLNAPLMGLAIGKKNGVLPSPGGMISLEPQELVLSSVTQSEDRESLLIRVFNCSAALREAVIQPGFTYKGVEAVNLMEEKADIPIEMKDGMICFSLEQWQIVTLRLSF